MDYEKKHRETNNVKAKAAEKILALLDPYLFLVNEEKFRETIISEIEKNKVVLSAPDGFLEELKQSKNWLARAIVFLVEAVVGEIEKTGEKNAAWVDKIIAKINEGLSSPKQPSTELKEEGEEEIKVEEYSSGPGLSP